MRPGRYVSLGQVVKEAEHFLRAEFNDVPGVRLTGISGNVQSVRISGVARNAQNPHPHLLDEWGRRMLKVWGDAAVSVNSLVPSRPVSFQIEVYVTRDGKQIGHSGTLISKDLVDTGLEGRGLSIIQLKEVAREYLKSRFRTVRQVRIVTVRESAVDDAYVYEVWGDGAVSENEVPPAILIYFQFRLHMSKDGKVTLKRAATWSN